MTGAADVHGGPLVYSKAIALQHADTIDPDTTGANGLHFNEIPTTRYVQAAMHAADETHRAGDAERAVGPPPDGDKRAPHEGGVG